jgi:hypothetical protein
MGRDKRLSRQRPQPQPPLHGKHHHG